MVDWSLFFKLDICRKTEKKNLSVACQRCCKFSRQSSQTIVLPSFSLHREWKGLIRRTKTDKLSYSIEKVTISFTFFAEKTIGHVGKAFSAYNTLNDTWIWLICVRVFALFLLKHCHTVMAAEYIRDIVNVLSSTWTWQQKRWIKVSHVPHPRLWVCEGRGSKFQNPTARKVEAGISLAQASAVDVVFLCPD